MATFKVNDRVRVIAPQSQIQGAQGTVWRVDTDVIGFDWGGVSRRFAVFVFVDIDGLGKRDRLGYLRAYEPQDLAPLTDPSAERFVESLKRLAREPLSVVERAKA